DGTTIIIESERSLSISGNTCSNACYLVLEMSNGIIQSVGQISDLGNWNHGFGQGSTLNETGLIFVIPLQTSGGYQLFKYARNSKSDPWVGPTQLTSSYSQNHRPTFS